MPIQRSEDPARNLLGIWLGPSGSWRWPFDATFTEWGLGSAAFVVIGTAMTFIVPKIAVLVLLSLVFARWMATRVELASWVRLLRVAPERARPRARRILVSLGVGLGLMIYPSLTVWLLPMPWYLAVFASLYLTVRFVKAVRPHVNGNQPVTYWLKAFRLVAQGPRLRRQPMALTPGELHIENVTPTEVFEFEVAVMAYNVEEMIVLTYKEKSPLVEAVLFDSTARDARLCEGVVAWLRARNVKVRVDSIKRGPEGVMRLARIWLVVNGTYLKDNHVIVLDPETGLVRQFTRTQFALTFEAQRTIEEEVASREVVRP